MKWSLPPSLHMQYCACNESLTHQQACVCIEIFSLIVLVPVQVLYDPQEVQYEKLLDTFFQHVDPTTKDRQGGDRGTQYRSAIYCHTPEQKAAAQKVRLPRRTLHSPPDDQRVAGRLHDSVLVTTPGSMVPLAVMWTAVQLRAMLCLQILKHPM